LHDYKALSGRENFAEFSGRTSLPEDKQVYVHSLPESGALNEGPRLRIVYRGGLSDVVAAVKPELDRIAAPGSCCRSGSRFVMDFNIFAKRERAPTDSGRRCGRRHRPETQSAAL
jgi:hypothetical protein